MPGEARMSLATGGEEEQKKTFSASSLLLDGKLVIEVFLNWISNFICAFAPNTER